MQTKKCVDCGETLPLDEFYKAKGYAGGVHTACKKCFRIRNAKSAQKHADARREGRRKYRVGYRQRMKSQDQQDVQRVSEEAKRRAKEIRDERRKRMNPEQLAEFRRKRAEGKRIHRAKKYGSGGRHSQAEWETLLAACGGKCVRCGASGKLTRDHIIPLSRGGSDDISNVQPLCKSCNSSKGNRIACDYRSGEQKELLQDGLAKVECAECMAVCPLTTKRRRFCSLKCCQRFYNRRTNKRKSYQRLGRRIVARYLEVMNAE